MEGMQTPRSFHLSWFFPSPSWLQQMQWLKQSPESWMQTLQYMRWLWQILRLKDTSALLLFLRNHR